MGRRLWRGVREADPTLPMSRPMHTPVYFAVPFR
jgi:hypothetical protein